MLNGPDDMLARWGPEWGIEFLRRPWRTSGSSNKSPDPNGFSYPVRSLPDVIGPAVFPDGAWSGLFLEYHDLVANSCEAPPAFHHGVFNAIGRALLGPYVKLEYVTLQPINDYFVLLGRTGFARKDTAKRRGKDLLTGVQEGNERVGYLPGIGSGEGLLDHLLHPAELEKLLEKKKGRQKSQVFLGRSLFLHLGELRTLLNKSNQDFVKATLAPLLNELWDGASPVGLPTRGRPFQVKDGFLTILGGSTQEWLSGFLTEENTLGGVYNRFLFYPGQDDRDLAYPENPDPIAWGKLVQRLRNIVSYWESRGVSRLAIKDPKTKALWEAWYVDFKKETRARAEYDAAILVRLPDHVMRQAAFYAALDCAGAIETVHLAPALLLGTYWKAAYTRVWNGGGETLNSRLAQTIRRHLGGGPLRSVELLRKLGGHRDRVQIDRVLMAMLRLKELRLEEGRYMLAG